MFSFYLNQIAQYEQLKNSGVDLYGNASYLPPQPVRCRREFRQREVLDREGRSAVSTITYYVDNTIEPQISDKLDGYLVLDRTEYVDGSGARVGWEVYG